MAIVAADAPDQVIVGLAERMDCTFSTVLRAHLGQRWRRSQARLGDGQRVQRFADQAGPADMAAPVVARRLFVRDGFHAAARRAHRDRDDCGQIRARAFRARYALGDGSPHEAIRARAARHRDPAEGVL